MSQLTVTLKTVTDKKTSKKRTVVLKKSGITSTSSLHMDNNTRSHFPWEYLALRQRRQLPPHFLNNDGRVQDLVFREQQL